MTVINYIFESILVLGVFYCYYYFFLANQTCHQFKRFYLLFTAIAGMVYPFIHLPVSQSSKMAVVLLPELSIDGLTTIESSSPVINYLGVLYILVAAILIIRFALHLFKILSVIKRHQNAELNEFRIVYSKNFKTRSSFFKFIFWNSDTIPDSAHENLILRHEIAHAKGWHSLDILFFEISKILLWFNPIIYWYQKEAVINLEYLADSKSAPQDHTTYNSLLAISAIESLGFSMENHFNKSFTLKRIKMLNRKNVKPSRVMMWSSLPIALLLLLIVSCETGADEPQGQISSSDANIEEFVEGNAQGAIYEKTDDQPEPVGGMAELYGFIGRNMKYPSQARKMGIEGRVFVEFIVETDGSISNVKSVKGIGAGCDMESVRVLQTSPKWNPGLIAGKPVRTRMILPISFKLN
ncbi:MAG: M56 family metallopeptidase [Bacteroidetes bacterium]|nr:M56 family metallopeptidase [Bacteroidota bacterium]MDA1120160.1 M56 family metallopeptidase [Bacteroidota bacterium]